MKVIHLQVQLDVINSKKEVLEKEAEEEAPEVDAEAEAPEAAKEVEEAKPAEAKAEEQEAEKKGRSVTRLKLTKKALEAGEGGPVVFLRKMTQPWKWGELGKSQAELLKLMGVKERERIMDAFRPHWETVRAAPRPASAPGP